MNSFQNYLAPGGYGNVATVFSKTSLWLFAGACAEVADFFRGSARVPVRHHGGAFRDSPGRAFSEAIVRAGAVQPTTRREHPKPIHTPIPFARRRWPREASSTSSPKPHHQRNQTMKTNMKTHHALCGLLSGLLLLAAGTAQTHAGLLVPAAPGAELYVSNASIHTIEKFTTSGVGSVFSSSGMSDAHGMAFDSAGNLYVADFANKIWKFTPGGVGSVFANTGVNSPYDLALTAPAIFTRPTLTTARLRSTPPAVSARSLRAAGGAVQPAWPLTARAISSWQTLAVTRSGSSTRRERISASLPTAATA